MDIQFPYPRNDVQLIFSTHKGLYANTLIKEVKLQMQLTLFKSLNFIVQNLDKIHPKFSIFTGLFYS